MRSYRRPVGLTFSAGYEDTQFLARFNNGHTSTVFADESKNVLVMTAAGGGVQTSSNVWAGNSAYEGGTNRRVGVADASALTSPGANDFTVDIRAMSTGALSGTAGLSFRVSNSAPAPWHLGWDSGLGVFAQVWNAASTTILLAAKAITSSNLLGVYHRWTLARNGNFLGFWFDGELVGYVETTDTLIAGTQPWGIGATQNIGANYWSPGVIGRFSYFSRCCVFGRRFNPLLDFSQDRAAFPDLSSGSYGTFTINIPSGSWPTTSFTCVVHPDGFIRLYNYAGTLLTTVQWLDGRAGGDQWSSFYNVHVVNEATGDVATPTVPHQLSATYTISATTIGAFNFQVTIVPRSNNPRYSESLYFGAHTFTLQVNLV